jgi:hypothetical protein
VDVNYATIGYVGQSNITPSYAKAGIILPGTNNPCGIEIGSLLILGQRIGLNIGEHTLIRYLTLASCDHALEFNFNNGHGSHIARVCFAECNYLLDGGSPGCRVDINIDQADIEGLVTLLVNDANNTLVGRMRYRSAANGGGAGTGIDSGAITGGARFHVVPSVDDAGATAVLAADYALPTSSGTVIANTWQNTGCTLTLQGAGDHTVSYAGTMDLGTPTGAVAGVVRLYDVTNAAAVANSEVRAVTGPQTSGAFYRTLNYRTSGEGTVTLRLEAEVTGGTSAVTATVKSGATGRTSLTLLPS